MDAKLAFAKAAIRILHPLIRILMRHEISYVEFSELAKQAYIDVAYRDFSIPNRKTTYSRVAVLTGLSRKEVVRLTRQEDDSRFCPDTPFNRAARVINGWLKDEEFQYEQQSGCLPLKGDHASFEHLVQRYSGDVTPGSILDELLRVEAVVVTDEGVQLKHHAFIPQQSALDQLDVVTECSVDFLQTLAHNLENNADNLHFQRQLVYRQVPARIAARFKKYTNKKSQALLLDYNRWLSKNIEKTADDTREPTQRVGVGIYYFDNDNTSRRS